LPQINDHVVLGPSSPGAFLAAPLPRVKPGVRRGCLTAVKSARGLEANLIFESMARALRILILYASTDGQTARIAERIGARLAESGYRATVRDVGAVEALWEIDTHDAVIVGGSVRYGRHSKALVERVRTCREALGQRPNAFFSVSLSAGGPGAKPELARRFIAAFVEATGWQPREVASFAGALRYRSYGLPLRWMMRFIVGREGGETDTSRDHEYTDWNAVDAFAARFAAQLAPAAAA